MSIQISNYRKMCCNYHYSFYIIRTEVSNKIIKHKFIQNNNTHVSKRLKNILGPWTVSFCNDTWCRCVMAIILVRHSLWNLCQWRENSYISFLCLQISADLMRNKWLHVVLRKLSHEYLLSASFWKWVFSALYKCLVIRWLYL